MLIERCQVACQTVGMCIVMYRHQLSRGWGLYKPWYQEGVTKIKVPGTGIRDQIENPMNNQGPRRRPSEKSEIRERADPYTPPLSR